MQFFICYPARWLRPRRFNEPTFRLSRATNHWKNKVFRDLPSISRTCLFFLLLTLSLSLFYSSLFHSSLLCFLSLRIVGNLFSKLPLIKIWLSLTTNNFGNDSGAHLSWLSVDVGTCIIRGEDCSAIRWDGWNVLVLRRKINRCSEGFPWT